MTATAVLGIGGTILPWHPTFNGPDMAWLRVGFFIGLAATGFMPIFQIILTRGSAWAYEFYLDSNLVKSLLVYVFGACIYASKVPERWFPGAFDFFGNAHNLWHVGNLDECITNWQNIANQINRWRSLEGSSTIISPCYSSSRVLSREPNLGVQHIDH